MLIPILALSGILASPPWPEGMEQLRIQCAKTLDPGEVEIEVIGEHLSRSRLTDQSLTLEIEAGVLPWLMLEVEAPWRRAGPDGAVDNGLGDLEFESRFALHVTDTYGLAIGVGVEVPTGDETKGLGGGEAELEANLIGSIAVDRLDAHLMLGVEGEEQLEGWRMTSAAQYRWPGFVEIRAQLGVDVQANTDTAAVVILGVEAIVTSWLDEVALGVGVPLGLTDAAEDWGIIIDLEFEP